MATPSLKDATTVSVQFQETCFVCGRDNPRGLQLEFRIDPDGAASSSWVPDIHWEGLRGIVHGGIIATLLDEAMAKAVSARGCKSMTAELRVRFHQYARMGEALQLKGWIVSQKRRLIETEATITACDGSERAHAWARFLSVTRHSVPAQAQ